MSAVDIEIETEADKVWMFCSNSGVNKTPGLLHFDVWQGTAVELAMRRHIAIYPVSA